MAHPNHTELRRAFDDLGKGVRALFGLDGSSPDLVRELLHGGAEPERHECCNPACRARHGAPPRERSAPARPRRRSRGHLVRVK